MRWFIGVMLCWGYFLSAQTAQIIQSLDALQTNGSILYIAAHPDDENTRFLSWAVNEKHYRTAYLSLTRGDGGQNLIGEEQGQYLGMIRTHELLEARKVDGAQQFFTRAYDFGYSKTPEETLTLWNKQEVLKDMVFIIRKFQPDIMICRFPTTGEGGHGHHTASAMLAEEAFDAAADPTKFPEQLSQVTIWQAQRLLWNTYNFGTTNTTNSDQFKVEVGEFNSQIGKSYGEIAAESRSKHSSQAFGTAKNRSAQTEYFKTIKGTPPVSDLMDGVNSSWNRFSNGNILQSIAQKLTTDSIRLFAIQSPEKLIPHLINLYIELKNNTEIPPVWKMYHTKNIQNLLLTSVGGFAEAYTSKPLIAVGDTLPITVSVVQRNPKANLKIISIAAQDQNISVDSVMPSGKLFIRKLILQTGNQKEDISQPYWLIENIKNNMFSVPAEKFQGEPILNNSPAAMVKISIEGEIFTLSLPVQYKWVNPSKGEVYQPLYITPPLALEFSSQVLVSNGQAPITLTLKTEKYIPKTPAVITLTPPTGWNISPATIELSGQALEAKQVFNITLTPRNPKPGTYSLQASALVNGINWNYGIKRIQYEHIPELIYFSPAAVKINISPMTCSARKIGYIEGAGDQMAEALKDAGIEVIEITEKMMLENKLNHLDAIITGVRTWNTEPRMASWIPYLNTYVKNGGIWVNQYNTSNGLLSNNFGPYPFKLSRDRVTDENATVTFINPQHRLLNHPNKITTEDFENWVQERGLYFPSDLASEYETLLSMSDPGETQLKNGIIIAPYGKGKYIYTSLSFFRQIPAGVPGAYRLFFNLISP
ncbi:MAG: PIG-L family deacetylase [Sphingobacteriia bacterium]|nr:PIG-L family deacetylase [Sphingobacteriia bacterium]